jgi:hypothetical protein
MGIIGEHFLRISSAQKDEEDNSIRLFLKEHNYMPKNN